MQHALSRNLEHSFVSFKLFLLKYSYLKIIARTQFRQKKTISCDTIFRM